MKNAKRPLILAGGGVHLSNAAQTLESFAETFSLPVAHTMTGKGSISCNNPLSAGLFGRYDRIANQFIETSDCLLVIGCKLGEIATKRFTLPPKNIPVIHLEVVAEEIGCRISEVESVRVSVAVRVTEEKRDALAVGVGS